MQKCVVLGGLLFLIVASSAIHSDSELVTSIISALSKMLKYYNENYKLMNLDGIYGLRILHDQMKILYRKVPRQNKAIVEWLHNSLSNAEETIKASLPFVKERDNNYYKLMKHVIERSTEISKPYRQLDFRHAWNATAVQNNTRTLTEEQSDKCMAEVMGSGETDKPCLFSDSCLSLMLERGHDEYYITHQLLYTLLVEQFSCVPQFEEHTALYNYREGMAEVQLELCTNNYLEMSLYLSKFNMQIPSIYQDLFMEQQFVCPLLGFYEFLRTSFLRKLLSWQSDSGCYKDDSSGIDVLSALKVLASSASGNQTLATYDKKQNYLKNARSRLYENRVPIKPSATGRKLLFELELAGKCLAHKTAVAAAALSQYLRFLLEPEAEQLYDVLTMDLTKLDTDKLSSSRVRERGVPLVDDAGDILVQQRQSKQLNTINSADIILRKRKETQVNADRSRQNQIIYDYYDDSNQSLRVNSLLQASRSDNTYIPVSTVLQAHLSVWIFLLPIMFFLYQCLKRFRTVIRYTVRAC